MRHLRRLALLLVVTSVGALGAARAADAVNYVPNPGFESCTAGQPNSWTAFGVATIGCDSTNPHSGSNSLSVSGAGGNAGAQSSCVQIAPNTSLTDFSMWYRTASASVVQVAFSVVQFSSTDCSGGGNFSSVGAGTSFGAAIATDGAWHQVTGTSLTLGTTQSVYFQLNFQCNPACASATVNYDDLAYANAVTAAAVRSFAAVATRPGVRLQWRTASESDVLGFNLYRIRNGVRVRVNRALIKARGSLAGGRYSFLDRKALRGISVYRLEVVSRDGRRAWSGSASVRLR